MIFQPFFTVGVLDPFSLSFNKKNRSINIEGEPIVGAILQPGNNLNSIEDFNQNKHNLNDDHQDVFSRGYGKIKIYYLPHTINKKLKK